MIKTDRVVIVEGKYDKIKLSSIDDVNVVVDAIGEGKFVCTSVKKAAKTKNLNVRTINLAKTIRKRNSLL